MSTMTSNQMLLDVFTTALEGGINYWSACEQYHWSKGAVVTADGLREVDDLYGFFAIITDVEDDDKQYRIDREVIKRGIAWLKNHPFGDDYQRRAIQGLVFGKEDVDYDADTADAIVQAGLFNEIVYG